MPMMRDQSGNVLFYILIAVALLAALSYVVAQSGRGSVGQITSERAALYANEIIDYGNLMSQTVDQIRFRGYLEGQISFENPIVSGYANASCSYDECQVFHVNGGAMNYVAPKTDWLDSAQSAQAHYGEYYIHGGTSADGLATSRDDLILFLPYVKQEVCVAINDRLGSSPVNRVVPVETNGPFEEGDVFTGTYGATYDYKVSGDGTSGETTVLFAKSAGCTESSGGGALPPAGTYHYFQVLLAR